MDKAAQVELCDEALAFFAEGLHLLTLNKDDAAERCFWQATALAPEFAEAHANLGYLLDRRGELEHAERCYLEALEQGAYHVETFLSLGALLIKSRRFGEARVALEEALAIDPCCAETWSNLGALHVCLHEDRQAEHCYRKALSLAPTLSSANINLAHLLLRKGHLVDAWQHLEARDWYSGLAHSLPMPRWRGEDLYGKDILITAEAGHGDMIQFCRYANEIKKRGARQVGILCQPALKRLFESLDAADAIIALGEPVGAHSWHYWSPALSLHCFCNTTLESIPNSIPYLYAEPRLPAIARRMPDSLLKVGLAWRGNPRFESDSSRSIPHLAHLTSLWSVPDICFFSLQKGAGEADATALSSACPIIDLGPHLSDFADTAAAIMALDLVISVDTAVAHLAGALGRPCWVLLPAFNTDWRWLELRSDSPWYPGCMRLFRQQTDQDWRPVIAEVERALLAWAQTSRSKLTQTYAI